MSSVGNVGSHLAAMLAGPGSASGRGNRPDATGLVDKMFARIDGNGDGGIDKSELTSAMGRFSKGGAGDANSGIDKMFASFDADGSGTISKQEVRDGIASLQKQLEAQFQQMRTSGADGPGALGGMPPAAGAGQDPFSMLDADQNGSLSKAEFGAISQSADGRSLLDALLSKMNNDGTAGGAEPDQWRKAIDTGTAASTATNGPQSFDPVDGLMAMVARQYATSAPLAAEGPSLQATA